MLATRQNNFSPKLQKTTNNFFFKMKKLNLLYKQLPFEDSCEGMYFEKPFSKGDSKFNCLTKVKEFGTFPTEIAKLKRQKIVLHFRISCNKEIRLISNECLQTIPNHVFDIKNNELLSLSFWIFVANVQNYGTFFHYINLILLGRIKVILYNNTAKHRLGICESKLNLLHPIIESTNAKGN